MKNFPTPVFETILVKRGTVPMKKKEINSREDASEFVRTMLAEKTREEVIVVLLDPKCAVMGVETVHKGTPLGCDIYIPNVLTPAILANVILL